MPWKEPGKGDNNGWKSGGSDRPPDLDEVFQKVSDSIRRLFGGGNGGQSENRGRRGRGGGFSPLALVGFALLLWVIFDSPHIVDEAERGVVLRFGDYSRTLQPGLNFTFPRPIERMIKVDVNEVRSVQNRAQMLTGDENLLSINFETQYRVSEAEKFLFNVEAPEAVLAQAAESALRDVVGNNEMDFILEEGRGQVTLEAGELLQTILTEYDAGMFVTEFNLPNVQPPSQVKPAFEDVIEAREDRDRFVNEAEAYANEVVPEARGAAARILEDAEAYRRERIALAEGEAERFTLLMDEYQKAPEVTRERLYLQAMEQVLGDSTKILISADNENILYLPMGSENMDATRMSPPAVQRSTDEFGGNDQPARTENETTRRGRTSRGGNR